jgi:serine/threonine-protein kinase HipA
MTLNGKRNGFSLADFDACAKSAMMKRGRAKVIVAEVQAAVERWSEFAAEAKLKEAVRDKIQRAHPLTFPRK